MWFVFTRRENVTSNGANIYLDVGEERRRNSLKTTEKMRKVEEFFTYVLSTREIY